MTARFKDLTVENWLEADETIQAFGRLSLVTGQVHGITKEEFASTFLGVQLGSPVPEEIVSMFKVAQGTLCYGYFFYPLYALGQEQLWRVCEAALGEKSRWLDAPSNRKSFAQRIEWMHHNGHLTDEQEVWWSATRRLRNSASHPSFQSLSMPIELPGDLRKTAHAINCLFDDSLDFLSLWHSR
jgi:hypothetical protein